MNYELPSYPSASETIQRQLLHDHVDLSQTAVMESTDAREYDIEHETAASRAMLEKRIPARLNTIKLTLAEINKRGGYEPWWVALMLDLVASIEYNCEQLLETLAEDRLPASAWIARNLLELLVWIKYCGISKKNARRFHEDVLRDIKGLTEAHMKICAAVGVADATSEIAAQRIQQVASAKLGLDHIDSKFLEVASAARAPGVGLGDMYGPSHRFLSKFAHPTAALVHGIRHQAEACRQLQAGCTTQGVYFAAQSTLAVEAQLGIPQLPE